MECPRVSGVANSTPLGDRDKEYIMGKKSDHGDIVSSVHFHISNSGVTFSVVDTDFGPAIQVSADSFGHPLNDLLLYTTTDGLERLGQLFEGASEHTFKGKVYCHAAHPKGPDPCFIEEHKLYHLVGGKCPCKMKAEAKGYHVGV